MTPQRPRGTTVQFRGRPPKTIHRDGFVTIVTHDGHLWLCEEDTYWEAVAAGEMAPHVVIPPPTEGIV